MLGVAQDLVPEGVLLLGALVVGALGVLRPAIGHRLPMGLSIVTLAVAGLSSLAYLRGMPAPGYTAFADGLVVDRYAVFAVVVLCLFAALTALSGDTVRERVAPHPCEYHALLLSATLGAVLLASAREMIALYVALELLSLSLCGLVAMVKTDGAAGEAAFKYLVLGGAASAVLLYGLAILYGLSGSTVLTEVAAGVRGTPAAGALGIVLVLGGLGFKLGAVPFQHWVPDVHEGAPAPVVGLVASLGGAAGVLVIARVAVASFAAQASTWTAVVAVMATASMVLGSLAALAQTRMRRLLGWSSVAQAGFVLVGLLGWRSGDGGIGASLFALLVLGIASIGAFAAVGLAEAAGVGPRVVDYRGLGRRSPLAATMLGLALLSLVGVPPLVGFFAKLFVLEAAVSAGYAWLLVVALATTVVSGVGCLRIVKTVAVDAPAEEAAPPLRGAGPTRAALGLCALATVGLGIVAQPLLALAAGGAGSLH